MTVVSVNGIKLLLELITKGGVSVISRFFLVSTLLAAVGLITAAQQQPTAVAVQTPVPNSSNIQKVRETESDERYRIGPGDLLDIRVFRRPELSRDAVRVDARGVIRMPLIKDEIGAACRTEGELEKEIETAYRKYLLDPQVSVFVKDFQSQPVAVVGAVKAPGRFILQRRVHLLELLSFVGGASDTAGRTIQVIHADQTLSCNPPDSTNTDGARATGVNFYELSATLQGDPSANPFVQQGDIITVPQADQALVVGNVLKPSAVSLKDPITLTRAIALAGGLLPDTNRERVRIVRQSGETTTTDIYVNLKAVAKRQVEDPILKPNDIVEISQITGGVKVLKDMLRTMVPTAASLPIRVIPAGGIRY
jgi:polysaccharide biosynthesis/export protein